MRRLALTVASCLLAAAGGGCGSGRDSGGSAPGLTVAAASDLRPAFTELGRRFTEQEGVDVTFSFGSSGQLAQQIVNGAPFDLFASADAGFVDQVIASGRGDASSKQTYALGRIVVWSPDRRILLRDVAQPSIRALAVANPDHAPYGAAARQALVSAGVLDRVRDRLVLGENVSDTLRLARSGNADAAIVALSLVLAAGDGAWTLVDPAAHEPLEQALVVIPDSAGAREARRFAAFVGSDAGRRTMRRHGLLLPGERLPPEAEG